MSESNVERITTRSMRNGLLDTESSISKEVVPQLQSLVKELEAEIWFGGLRDQLLKESAQGHSAIPEDISTNRDPVKMFSYVIAGRCMLQMERGDIFISMVVDETSYKSTAGLQGVNATLEEARLLVEDAIAQWKAGCPMTPDNDVRLL